MCRYGTFAYKAIVKLPWVEDEVYVLAEQDTAYEAIDHDEENGGRRHSRKHSIEDSARVSTEAPVTFLGR